MRFKRRSKSPLHKQARRGFRGYPVATVAFYGPDDKRATKVAVGIIPAENAKVSALERWFAEDDVRNDIRIANQIASFIKQHGALTVVSSPGIIGCPHEERIDYPQGQVCPQCPFWAKRDRWTGFMIQ